MWGSAHRPWDRGLRLRGGSGLIGATETTRTLWFKGGDMEGCMGNADCRAGMGTDPAPRSLSRLDDSTRNSCALQRKLHSFVATRNRQCTASCSPYEFS